MVYVLALVGTGFIGALAVFLVIGMVDTPHNATQENMAYAAGAFLLAIVGVLTSDWVSKRAGQ